MLLVRRVFEEFATHDNLEYLIINSVNKVRCSNEHVLTYQAPEGPYVDLFIPRAINDRFWCSEKAR
jgi:hypothetical protein